MLGPAHGQMIVTALIALLERQKTLPCPRDCPHEVKVHIQTTTQHLVCHTSRERTFNCPSVVLLWKVYMLMKQCWDVDPLRRPDFSALVNSMETIRQSYECQLNGNISLKHINF